MMFIDIVKVHTYKALPYNVYTTSNLPKESNRAYWEDSKHR